jgi:two-component system, sensor histidine kinase RegB
MTVRAEIASSPAAPGSSKSAAKPGLPPRGTVRLRALVLIRWAAVAGQFFTAAVAHWGLGFGLPVLAVGGTIALSALLNLTVSLGRPASARIDDREAAIFLAFDILQLAVLLYLTGGLTNPFSLLLLAPVVIGATILSLASNIALSLLTIASIAVLGLFHQPLPWRGPPPELPEIYQAGVWAGLTLTTLLITLYGWRLAEEARQMAAALAAAHVGARRPGRCGGARTRLAALDHRRHCQGNATRDRVRRSLARGCRIVVRRVRALSLDSRAPLDRPGG